MSAKKTGQQTAVLASPPTILCAGNVVGRMEGEGPLAACFDYVDQDDTFGEATWEQSERAMQQKALALALQKGGLTAQQLDWLFAGDLLNQCVSSSYAAREQKIPFFGLYGACSTFGEGLILASMALYGGFGERAGVVVSSHFCTAERQYRTPLEYGCQRTPTAQWTVTGAGAVILQQFANPANSAAHREQTGREILEQAGREIHGFCSGIGTGGTITGIGETLKAANPEIEIWALEPDQAAILSGGKVGTHLQMGIGDGVIPEILNQEIYDQVITVTDQEALETARELARKEGLMCGISSGTNVAGARKLARKLGPGKTVVTILADTAERYFSTPLFD